MGTAILENATGNPSSVSHEKRFTYHGTGKELFGMYIVNMLLSIITVGLYYPWAKAAIMRFHYSATEFLGSRFTFHGTGQEMFKGMIMSFLIIAAPLLSFPILINLGYYREAFILLLVYYFSLLFTIPLALVGTMRYRCSHSSWRGVHFSYSGQYKPVLIEFIKGLLLTLVTLGIYRFWFQARIIKKIADDTRFGNVQMKFTGEGGKYFEIVFFGNILTYLTLGIYFFKMQSKLYNYFINNIRMIQGDAKGTLKANTTGMGMFKLMAGNLLIIVLTFGLGAPWVIVRNKKFFTQHVYVAGSINFDAIAQADSIESGGSIGEAMFDEMDISLLF